MKVLDVKPFHEGIQRNISMLSRLETEVQAIEKSISALAAMDDALKGAGGEAIRSFYESCHIPFLEYFKSFKISFTTILKNMDSALTSLESNESGFIRQEFLEGEVERGLTSFGKITGELTDETNTSLTQVSDIVALPNLDDSDVQTDISQAQKLRDQTIQQLNEFDSSQLAALKSVSDEINKMKLWVDDVETMMSYGLTDFDFPASEWSVLTAAAPIRKGIDKNNGKAVSSPEKGNTVNDYFTMADRFKTALFDVNISRKMYGARNGLNIERGLDHASGKYLPRITATEEALKSLGIKIEENSQVYKELMRGLPKDRSKWKPRHYQIAKTRTATIKFSTMKSGSNGWSKAGNDILKNNQHLQYWNKDAKNLEKVKTIGKATVKGAAEAVTDVADYKNYIKQAKILAPVGAALSFSDNYQDAKKDGLDNTKAVGRATVDTLVETAVTGAVQTGSTALFTAVIPIPGVGTAVGAAVGLGLNYLLTKEDKKGKSVMNSIKDWFH
ncbi:LXG domain-containing protein [Metabacillus sp. KIGAM252]|uniref:LXG domain-containing protein n=1 Tax=Metabacillus flavus TaxID=2823519 RepID=A0ABS5LAP1_9BACI|nr:LXG domain-containing protein [Metabacillus flavus]MBS2967608.1 LXG domain-containing protein [Metabacillus flavus]